MKAVFYAQFDKSDRHPRGANLVATSKNPPRVINGQVLVRVELEIPDGAFEPLTASGIIEAGFVGIPIEVEAQPPVNEDEDDDDDG